MHIYTKLALALFIFLIVLSMTGCLNQSEETSTPTNTEVPTTIEQIPTTEPVTPPPVPSPTPLTIIPTPTPLTIPSSTPVVTSTVEATPTTTPTVRATVTPTATPTATATISPTAVPTTTPIPLPTATSTPTPLVVPTVEPTAIPTAEPTVQATDTSSMEFYILGEINAIRTNLGLRSLILDESISVIARDWSTQMGTGGFFSHRPGSQINILLPAGWVSWAENIASAPNVQFAQDSLEASPGHFGAMTDGSFTHVGIGVYVIGGQVLVTQNFVQY